MPNFDAFYKRLRTADRLPTTSQPSIGDFLDVYEPLVDQGMEVVSIHISGGISGTVERARQAKEQLAERKGVDRVTGDRLGERRGWNGTGGARGRAGGAGRWLDRRGRHAHQGHARAAQDVVRGRHARVPAPRRPDRRGVGVARLGAEDQADPHARAGDHSDRARADRRQGAAPPGRVRGAAARRRRRRVGRAAHPGARGGCPAWSATSSRSWVARRCSCQRSGPCSERTSGRDCWASAASRPACWNI